MPVRYVIDGDQGCIFLQLFGVIDDWGLGTDALRLWEEPGFNPRYMRLIDGTGITEMAAGKALLKAIAQDVRGNHAQKVALVNPFENARASFITYQEGLLDVSTQIFQDVTTAAEWLGVTLPTPWPPVT